MRSRVRFYTELGFNPRAREGAKRALVQHLFKNVESSSAENISTSSERASIGEQLTFDPALLGTSAPKHDPKK